MIWEALTQHPQARIAPPASHAFPRSYHLPLPCTPVAPQVEKDLVETVTMTVGVQKRAVLEAVAFGTFLRDVETYVQDDYALLTPIAPLKLPPGTGLGPLGNNGGDSDDDGDDDKGSDV